MNQGKAKPEDDVNIQLVGLRITQILTDYICSKTNFPGTASEGFNLRNSLLIHPLIHKKVEKLPSTMRFMRSFVEFILVFSILIT